MDEQIDILERIHAAYYQLTSTERKVADLVLAQPSQVQFMSITQLADECGTAEATVTRFCRRLNLKGFNAFKIELARHSASTSAKPKDREPNSLVNRSLEVGRLASDAVYQTIELVEPKQVLRAVELIESAQHVVCIGSGGSMIMAAECAHLFSTVSGNFQAVPDSHLQMSAVATMGQGDVVMLFFLSAIIAYLPVGFIAGKLGRKKTILAGVVMLTVAFGVAGFLTADSPTMLMNAMFALAGIAWATINVNSFPMVVELCSGGSVGKYTGFYYTASMAAQVATPMLSGLLMDKLGMGVLFPYATVFVALAFVTMLFVHHGDSKPEARLGLDALENMEND